MAAEKVLIVYSPHAIGASVSLTLWISFEFPSLWSGRRPADVARALRFGFSVKGAFCEVTEEN